MLLDKVRGLLFQLRNGNALKVILTLFFPALLVLGILYGVGTALVPRVKKMVAGSEELKDTSTRRAASRSVKLFDESARRAPASGSSSGGSLFGDETEAEEPRAAAPQEQGVVPQEAQEQVSQETGVASTTDSSKPARVQISKTQMAALLGRELFTKGGLDKAESEALAVSLVKSAVASEIDPLLLLAVIASRSRVQAGFSNEGRFGYFGFTPEEFKSVVEYTGVPDQGHESLIDPGYDLTVGVGYLVKLNKTLKGNEKYVLLAFEMGFAEFLAMAREKTPIPETAAKTVKQVFAFRDRLSQKVDERLQKLQGVEPAGSDVSQGAAVEKPPVESAPKQQEVRDETPTPAPTEPAVVPPAQQENTSSGTPQAASTGDVSPSLQDNPFVLSREGLRTLNPQRDLTAVRVVLPDFEESRAIAPRNIGGALIEPLRAIPGKQAEASSVDCNSTSSCIEALIAGTPLAESMTAAEIEEFGQLFRVDPILVLLIGRELSGLDPSLVQNSPKRVGIFQFRIDEGNAIARAARLDWRGAKDLAEADYSLRLGIRYADYLWFEAKQDIAIVIAGFLQSHERAKQLLAGQSIKESYQERVNGLLKKYRSLTMKIDGVSK